jgi:hypothetical protein
VGKLVTPAQRICHLVAALAISPPLRQFAKFRVCHPERSEGSIRVPLTGNALMDPSLRSG